MFLIELVDLLGVGFLEHLYLNNVITHGVFVLILASFDRGFMLLSQPVPIERVMGLEESRDASRADHRD